MQTDALKLLRKRKAQGSFLPPVTRATVCYSNMCVSNWKMRVLCWSVKGQNKRFAPNQNTQLQQTFNRYILLRPVRPHILLSVFVDQKVDRVSTSWCVPSENCKMQSMVLALCPEVDDGAQKAFQAPSFSPLLSKAWTVYSSSSDREVVSTVSTQFDELSLSTVSFESTIYGKTANW